MIFVTNLNDLQFHFVHIYQHREAILLCMYQYRLAGTMQRCSSKGLNNTCRISSILFDRCLAFYLGFLPLVGIGVGLRVGSRVGRRVGMRVGRRVGVRVGFLVGAAMVPDLHPQRSGALY